MSVPLGEAQGVPEHNNGYDSLLTRPFAQAFESLAGPLVDHFYGPLTEKNHALGLIAANATLTAPRLAEPVFGRAYVEGLQKDNQLQAISALAGKILLKLTDGLDGPVTRATNTTSLAGAGFDAITDMLGTYDDAKRIKQIARSKGHFGTIALMNMRTAIDAGVILVGGVASPLATKFAKSRGVELTEHDHPKANAMAKAKFATSAVGNAAIEASYLFQDRKTSKRLHQTGLALTTASVVTGLISLGQYTRDTLSKVRRATATSPTQGPSNVTPLPLRPWLIHSDDGSGGE